MSWKIANTSLTSRLLLGTALYPSPHVMQQAILASGTNVLTVSLRRETATKDSNQKGHHIWDIIKASGCHLLPNTAGCRTAKEAITTAQMARELFKTNWIKLEVIGDEYNLQPNPFELLNATEKLLALGFDVLPYCTDDLVLCQHLVSLGCRVIMPWASPIGSGRGLQNPYALETLRQRLPDTTLIIDAGIGTPSDATRALEMGYDAVLLNSAIALATDPVAMAEAFKHAITAGHLAYQAGRMPTRNLAKPSTPTIGTPFWEQTTAETDT